MSTAMRPPTKDSNSSSKYAANRGRELPVRGLRIGNPRPFSRAAGAIADRRRTQPRTTSTEMSEWRTTRAALGPSR